MRKRKTTNNRLRLQKETIRNLVRGELHKIAGGQSCGAGTACGCSGGWGDWKTDPGDPDWTAGTLTCTLMQY